MNDRQLRSFVLAAEKGSFSKAAAAAYISTPAFVQQINLLERDVNARLFVRTRHGVELTEAGECFLGAAKDMLALYDGALARCRDIEDARQNSLRIAHSSDALPRPLQLAYQTLVSARSDASISFVQCPLAGQIEAVRSGAADISFIAEPQPELLEGVDFTPLARETYAFCMRKGHSLSLRRLLRPSDLEGRKVICGSYPYLCTPFAQALPAGIELEEFGNPIDAGIRLRAASSDDLLVIHSRWTAQYEGTLAVVPSSIAAGRIGCITRKDASNLAESFKEALRQNIDEL